MCKISHEERLSSSAGSIEKFAPVDQIQIFWVVLFLRKFLFQEKVAAIVTGISAYAVINICYTIAVANYASITLNCIWYRLVVQVITCKLMSPVAIKIKYHSCAPLREIWAFGVTHQRAVDYLEIVGDSSAQTLLPILQVQVCCYSWAA